MMNFNSDASNLREPTAFEVVSTDGEWVEFKIICCLARFGQESRVGSETVEFSITNQSRAILRIG